MHTKFRGLLVNNIDDCDAILTGIPFDKNASIGSGAKEAPDTIRELSAMIPPTSMNGYLIDSYKMFDNGNIASEDFKVIQEEVLNILNKNKFSIFIGGDHSIAIATERAFFDYAKKLNKEPVIIHIDAHPDICNEYLNNKYSHATPNKRSLDYGYKDENMTLIGVRGFEPQETKFLAEHPLIDVFKASDAIALGSNGLVNYLVNKYSNEKYMIYLSYDIDANDPAYAPGTGTPEPFGLNNMLVIEIIIGLIKNLNVGAFDIVEVSPKLDCNNITSYLAIKSLYEVLYEKQQLKLD